MNAYLHHWITFGKPPVGRSNCNEKRPYDSLGDLILMEIRQHLPETLISFRGLVG